MLHQFNFDMFQCYCYWAQLHIYWHNDIKNFSVVSDILFSHSPYRSQFDEWVNGWVFMLSFTLQIDTWMNERVSSQGAVQDCGLCKGDCRMNTDGKYICFFSQSVVSVFQNISLFHCFHFSSNNFRKILNSEDKRFSCAKRFVASLKLHFYNTYINKLINK